MKAEQSLFQRILYFPLVKIIAGFIACAIVIIPVQGGLNALLKTMALNAEMENLVGTVVIALLVMAVYTLLYRWYEKRKITELYSGPIGKWLIYGVLTGFILQVLTIFVIYLAHGFSIISVNKFVNILPGLGLAIGSAIFEEILFRGIIFRITEEKLGSYAALIFSALLFGAAHLANPNATFITALGIAIEAGLLLGTAYMYSRSLWLPIAIHFAWNFTQAGIFGATTSGNEISKSLLSTKIQGPVFISGGTFGPEGSAQAWIFCLIASIILIVLCKRQNKIINPYWDATTGDVADTA